MTTVLNQSLASIVCNNYADVIEGGSSHRGRLLDGESAYRGIPGLFPNDEGLTSGDDDELVVVGSSVSTTTFDVTGKSWDESRWVKENTPGFWAMINTAGSNYEQARKVTEWDNATGVFTVAPAWSASPSADDDVVMMQGFKRLPNGIDIEDDDAKMEGGFDRFFQLLVEPGDSFDYHGNGREMFKGSLELRLRLLKRQKSHDTINSAFTNMLILRSAMRKGANPDHRGGSVVEALIPEGSPKEETNDERKVVLSQMFTLYYRITSEFL